MRVILHSDLNNFYASVEVLKHPEYKNLPLVVVGDKAERHGIVLAKNSIAKTLGVKTGDVYWLAKQKCGNLIEITADFPSYLQISHAVRKIYEDYSNKVEAFGIDECWIEVTDTSKLFGSGEIIAEIIRQRIKDELGLTVSIGVSFNKIFAKLGSDMKKPDAITIITPQNFKEKVWVLPVEDLLYVGNATRRKLNNMNIFTIGDLANFNIDFLITKLGKWGLYLHSFANGLDDSPVLQIGEEENIKSIGNSLTFYKDLENNDEIKTLIYLLSESVSARMRETGFYKAKTLSLSFKDTNLIGYHQQIKFDFPTSHADDIAETAFSLFVSSYNWINKIRSLGISVSDFLLKAEQLNMFSDNRLDAKKDNLYNTLDNLRLRYGNNIIQRAIILKDQKLKNLDIKGEHTIHPYSFFKNKSK